MKKIVLLTLSIFITFTVCGCTTENSKNAASGKYCVECGAEATHFAGTGWVKSLDRNGALYLCDGCYEDMIKWAEENNRIVSDKWWE